MDLKVVLYLSLTLVISSFPPPTLGARILFLAPMGSRSHKIFYMGIVEALAERGHHVTLVSAHEPTKPKKNVEEIIVTNYDMDSVLFSVFEPYGAVKTLHNLFSTSLELCIDTLGQPQVQDLKKTRYDLVMISMLFGSCYLSLVHYFKVPFIYVSPVGMFGYSSNNMNNIDFPSFVPSKFNEASFPLSFMHRFKSAVGNTILSYYIVGVLNQRTLGLCISKGLCPDDMPSITEINKNASLAIVNSVRTIEWPPRPMMPNIIYAGGIHIKPAKELPKELEDWTAKSGENGFIYFSLGSTINTSLIPDKYRKVLLNVFGSLKQLVLWKSNEDSMLDLPQNVKLGKWFPQQNILGHPKLKLFITQGGFLSMQEATYNGVVILGMPLYGDQFSNLKEASEEGWGEVIYWENLEITTFRNLILKAIKDTNLKETSKRRSVLMRDRLISPNQEAVFWVEYVMRHKGAPHMMSPVRTMSWCVVYNMDVWAFTLGLALLLLYMSWHILRLTPLCGIFLGLLIVILSTLIKSL